MSYAVSQCTVVFWNGCLSAASTGSEFRNAAKECWKRSDDKQIKERVRREGREGEVVISYLSEIISLIILLYADKSKWHNFY